MFHYRYHWTLRPAVDVEIEVHIRADTAPGARRELVRFLTEMPSNDWTLCVLSRTRETERAETTDAADHRSVRSAAVALEAHASA